MMKMKMMMSALWLICLCTAALAQTERVIISPQFPQRGDVVTITYHADSKDAVIDRNTKNITLYFTYSNLYEISTKIQLQQKGNEWATSFTLPRYAVFATFYLQSGEAIDRPSATKLYELAVYDKNKERVQSGYLYNAYSLPSQMGRAPELRAAQKALYEEELKHYPKNYEAQLRLVSNELSSAATDEEKKALLKKGNDIIAAKYKENPGKMGNINNVTMGYLIMGESERLDSIRDVIRKDYPATSAGIELRADVIAKEQDKQKQFDMLTTILKEETPANKDAFGNIHSMLFEHYAAAKDGKNALYHARKMLHANDKEKDPYLPERYKEIAQTLLDNNTALDSAAAYANLALKNVNNFPVGLIRYFPETGYIPSYVTDSARAVGINTAKGNVLSLLAMISLKQQNIAAGKKYMEQALAASTDKETLQNAISFYEQTNMPAKASEAAWGILLEVPDDSLALKAFTKNYVAANGSESGMSNKLSQLDSIWTTKMQAALNKGRVNKQLPSLDSLVDMDGKPVTAAMLKNKIVILNFWATWCVPCMQEMPYMQKVYDKFKNNPGVFFLITNSGARNTIVDAQKWGGRKKYNFPVYFNGDTNLSDKLGFQVIPATYIIDEKGMIQFKLIGFEGVTIEKKVTVAIEMLLAAKTI